MVIVDDQKSSNLFKVRLANSAIPVLHVVSGIIKCSETS